MRYLVLIGDIVESRQSSQRDLLQRKLAGVLQALNADAHSLVSPYTLTLGDEFQGVFRGVDNIFEHMFIILGTLHPVAVRFSWAVGAISTDINADSAVGMDGPAFYAARDGVNALKASGEVCALAGLDVRDQPLANAALRVVSHQLGKWRATRHRVMGSLLAGRKVQDIARELAISEQAVYKNISSGGLDALAELFAALSAIIDLRLEDV